MNETPFLSAALKAISKGTPVFPCGAGLKTPLTSHGFQNAAPDETTIRQWAAKWPIANLAIPTGTRSGLLHDFTQLVQNRTCSRVSNWV